MVHLPLLVGELARRGGARGVHHYRAHELAVPVFARLVEEERKQRPHEPRHVADVERESRPRNLYAPAEVEQLFKLRQIPVRHGVFDFGNIAPLPDGDIVLGALSDGNAVVGQIGNGEQQALPLLFDFARGGLELLDALRHIFHFGEFCLELIGALREFGHRPARGVLGGASVLKFHDGRAPLGVERNYRVNIAVKVLERDFGLHQFRIFPEEFYVYHNLEDN